jgi:hypothetical protein
VPFVGEKVGLHGNFETFDPTKCIPPGLQAEITTQTARYFDISYLKNYLGFNSKF